MNKVTQIEEAQQGQRSAKAEEPKEIKEQLQKEEIKPEVNPKAEEKHEEEKKEEVAHEKQAEKPKEETKDEEEPGSAEEDGEDDEDDDLDDEDDKIGIHNNHRVKKVTIRLPEDLIEMTTPNIERRLSSHIHERDPLVKLFFLLLPPIKEGEKTTKTGFVLTIFFLQLFFLTATFYNT